MRTSAQLQVTRAVIAVAALLAAMWMRQPDHSLHPAKLVFRVDPAFRGILNIAVEDWHNSPQTIAMDLNAGHGSTVIGDERVRGGQFPHCGHSPNDTTAPSVVSADGTESIPCEWLDAVAVRGPHGERIASHIFVPHSQIEDVVWSPDSTSIAVLVEETRSEWFSKQGLFSLVHSFGPLHLAHYRLFLYSPKDGNSEELPFPYKEIQGAWATIEWLPS
jgi:hypothetical protein